MDQSKQFTITKKGSNEIIARIFRDDKDNWKAIVDDEYEIKELDREIQSLKRQFDRCTLYQFVLILIMLLSMIINLSK